jgi:carbamoyl-phosphate synthase/aspartate carbamoyltransferase/dihydroorotase
MGRAETLVEARERQMLELPGLIDPHVHLRDPGATHKEDFDTGTAAALAGGFTTVLAMPNTQPPLTVAANLELAQSAARTKARCDYGIFLGAGEENSATVPELANQACGLKVYMDQTYGPLRMRSLPALIEHFTHWPKDKVIACHAEMHSLAVVLGLAHMLERRVHICHVSRAVEIQLIRLAKERGTRVTCEVTPHHLFLSADDVPALGAGRSEVRPALSTTADVAALWESLEVIDCFATDHAPHTLEEKDGDNPPPGFPGLETALGVLLLAVREGRLTVDQLVARMHTNPRRIYDLPKQPATFVEFDPDAEWEARGTELRSRCGWTPFEGMKLRGRVCRVTLRGELAYENDHVIAPMGAGRDLMRRPIPT